MKTLVLLSGGLDSAVNLYKAAQESQLTLALTFDYGQRAASKEVAAAQFLTQELQIPHKIISLPWFKEFGKSGLLDSSCEVPQGGAVLIDDHERSLKTASAVWVPNRNGIFLNIAAGFAEALGIEGVVPGFNLEEASTFPDNSEDYLKSLTHSFSFSTSNKVQVVCYTTHLNKIEIMKMGRTLGVPFERLWPCYLAGDHWCGHCESCLRFQRAQIYCG